MSSSTTSHFVLLEHALVVDGSLCGGFVGFLLLGGEENLDADRAEHGVQQKGVGVRQGEALADGKLG